MKGYFANNFRLHASSRISTNYNFAFNFAFNITCGFFWQRKIKQNAILVMLAKLWKIFKKLNKK